MFALHVVAHKLTDVMIEFKCEFCGRAFAVPDTFAGKRAKCKTCRKEIVVPTSRASAPPADGARLSMRTRRLLAEGQQMKIAFHNSDIISLKDVAGDPPDIYQIEYRIESLQRDSNGKPVRRDDHVAQIELTSDYPRLSPKCKMLTPIFHPNIDETTICVGDHWTAGERLVDLVIRIGEMIAYQAYNIKSPLDAEAAMWADLNPQHLPTDARAIRPEEI